MSSRMGVGPGLSRIDDDAWRGGRCRDRWLGSVLMEPRHRLGPRALCSVADAAVSALIAHGPGIDGLDAAPVGDGDTGSNAAAALGALGGALGGSVSMVDARASLDAVEVPASFGVVGAWLVAFWQGLAEAAAATDDLDGARLAVAFELGVERAAERCDSPFPGGIDDVAGAAVEAALAAADGGGDLAAVLAAAAQAGVDALERTPQGRPDLTAAGVVDAGAAAFVVLLDAFCEVVGVADERSGDEVAGRYIVSLRLQADDTSATRLERVWGGLGGHVVLVAGEELVTDAPQTVRSWMASVSTDDIGAAIEAAIAAGPISRISVVDRRG